MLVQQFQSDPECRVFRTTNAGSVGLNLQSANTVVNVDLPWNPAILEQRIGRAHRMGQKRHVQVFLLVTEGTIEEGMLATLSAKHDLALAALDIGSEVSEVKMKSGVEELKRRLEVLLGSKLAAPVDISERRATQKVAESVLPQQDKIVQAGGELISTLVESLGKFVGTLTNQQNVSEPQSDDGEREQRSPRTFIQETITKAIHVETDSEGKSRISFTLPEKPVLDGFLQAATQWLTSLGGSRKE
jgi:superfamily II DNA/RNA helicase